MSEEYQGVYEPTSKPNTFESTPLANAGWYEEGQHGGSLAALVVHQVERVPTLEPMQIARLTIEIFRVVPLTPLTVEPRVIREGKRLQTVQVQISDEEGTTLSVATAQRLRLAERPLPDEADTEKTELKRPPQSSQTTSKAWGIGEPDKTMFHRDAVEIREIHGGFSEIGPGAIWVRSTTPVVAGESTTAAQRAVIAADFCNGVSRKLDVDKWAFMNSDLTVHIGRYPVGEWVALDASSSYSASGRGVASGVLWDESMWVGRSAQTLFLEPKQRNQS